MGLKKCRHTISSLVQQQRQECNMNVSDSYSIKWQHGGKLIRNMNYKMAISALRRSSLVQPWRIYQGGIAPFLALLLCCSWWIFYSLMMEIVNWQDKILGWIFDVVTLCQICSLIYNSLWGVYNNNNNNVEKKKLKRLWSEAKTLLLNKI